MLYLNKFINTTQTTFYLFITKYFTFRGRSDRKEYISLTILFYLLDYVSEFCFGLYYTNVTIPSALAGIVLFFPVMSATVRRLHDFNQRGLWILGVFMVTAFLVWCFYDHPILEGHIDLISWIWVICTYIPLFLIKGTSDPNRFGNEPE